MSTNNNDKTMTDVDALTSSMNNMEVDPSGPNAFINNLAEQLRSSTILDPSTSLEDAGRILETADPSTWEFGDGPKSPEQIRGEIALEVVIASMGYEHERQQALPQKVDQVHSQHQDNVSWPAPSALYWAPAELAQAVATQYGYYLDFEGESLAGADLPSDEGELEVLGFMISDVLWKRWQERDMRRMLVFSPWSHPCYPCWLEEHEINEVIMSAHNAMLASRYPGWVLEDEMDMS